MSDAVDKVDEAVKPKRGRPAKVKTQSEEVAGTPAGEARKKWAEQERSMNKKNPVVESFYELRGTKLMLCKRKKNGSTYRTLIGQTEFSQRASEELKQQARATQEQVKRLQAEGKLKVRV